MSLAVVWITGGLCFLGLMTILSRSFGAKRERSAACRAHISIRLLLNVARAMKGDMDQEFSGPTTVPIDVFDKHDSRVGELERSMDETLTWPEWSELRVLRENRLRRETRPDDLMNRLDVDIEILNIAETQAKVLIK